MVFDIIKYIPIDNIVSDKILFKESNDGCFKIKKIWDHIHNVKPNLHVFYFIWGNVIPPYSINC